MLPGGRRVYNLHHLGHVSCGGYVLVTDDAQHRITAGYDRL